MSDICTAFELIQKDNKKLRKLVKQLTKDVTELKEKVLGSSTNYTSINKKNDLEVPRKR